MSASNSDPEHFRSRLHHAHTHELYELLFDVRAQLFSETDAGVLSPTAETDLRILELAKLYRAVWGEAAVRGSNWRAPDGSGHAGALYLHVGAAPLGAITVADILSLVTQQRPSLKVGTIKQLNGQLRLRFMEHFH